MASTNKTTNYELSQFIGTDKPAWLSDYNGDMGKIDAGIHTAQTTATGADGKADSNATKIGNLANLTTTAKTDLVSAVNEVDTELGTVSGVASGASTNATSALTKVNALESALNFTNFKTYVQSDFTVTGGEFGQLDSMQCATNADGSVGKIYGEVRFKCTSSNGMTISFPSNLRPSSNITIVGCCWVNFYDNNMNLKDAIRPRAINIATDGTISTTFSAGYYNSYAQMNFVACLLFMKDFGDVPNN
jgi:hypothetical protein